MADVICPACNGRYHETTDAYTPDERTTGDMLRLKSVYVANGWASFYEDRSCPAGDIACPECDTLYDDGHGRVRVDQEQLAAEAGRDTVPCPICGKEYKKTGLASHVRQSHKV